MSLIVPCAPQGAHFSFAIELDGATWTLTFRWNHRVGQWVMSLGDAEGNAIIDGVRVVVNVPLLLRYRGRANTPGGDFLAVDTAGENRDPAFEDLGSRVQLHYLFASEL